MSTAIHRFADYDPTFLQGELIRRRAPDIDREAKLLIDEQVKALHDDFKLEPQMGAELKFTSYLRGDEANKFEESLESYLQGSGKMVKDPYCKNTGKLELDFWKIRPLGLLGLIQGIKDLIIKKSLSKGDGNSLSFIEGETHPHIHFNFSLWQEEKNIFTEMALNRTSLGIYLIDRLVEDLQSAFMVFALGQDAYKRFSVNSCFAPQYFSWSPVESARQELNRKRSGHALLLREINDPVRARLELRVPESSGIDSLQISFILGSILNSLDELVLQVKPSKTLFGPALLDYLNNGLEELEEPKLSSFRNGKNPLPKTINNAFDNFRKAFERMKKIFGEKIYKLLTAA